MINNKNLNLNCKQLTNGDLKRVESLSTEDFIRSAKSSPEVKIDQSTVTAIEPCNERGTVMITFSVGKDNVKVGYNHRLENRCVLKHNSNMNFHSWAVLGYQGCREKKIQTAISTTFEVSFFYVFMTQKIFNFFFRIL